MDEETVRDLFGKKAHVKILEEAEKPDLAKEYDVPNFKKVVYLITSYET